MCEKCKQAVDLLIAKGYSDKSAMDVLWSETAFPAGDGDFVLKQVREFIEKREKERKKVKKVPK